MTSERAGRKCADVGGAGRNRLKSLCAANHDARPIDCYRRDNIACNTPRQPTLSRATLPSFPLDRPRRLARHVIHHPVHAFHLVDDPRRDLAEELHVEGMEIRRRAPLRRAEISFSQGAEWKALISTYIGTIPLSGDTSCPVEHIIAMCPPPRRPVSSAMTAKVGAAARPSQPAAPSTAATLRRPVSSRAAIIAPPARSCRGGATRRPFRCALWGRGRATGTCPRARPARAHRSNRYDRRRRPRTRKR